MTLIVKGLSKKYGAQIAVDDLSFSIDKGRVVGFLGPNGAGKSTTLKMIAGYLQPDAGEVILNGISNQKNPIAFKKGIGYLPEGNPLYEEMYVKEYLTFISNIHGIVNPFIRFTYPIINSITFTFNISYTSICRTAINNNVLKISVTLIYNAINGILYKCHII